MTNQLMVALFVIGELGLAGCVSQVPLENSLCPCPAVGYVCCGTGPTATCHQGETCVIDPVVDSGVDSVADSGVDVPDAMPDTMPDAMPDVGSPDAPPALSRIVTMAIGHAHACVVLEDLTVTCIGDNSKGQATPPSGQFYDVVAGGDVTCGSKVDKSDITKDHLSVCWGDNTYGQASPPDGVSVQAIGARHACGTDHDGHVFCWGDNSLGQATPPAGIYSDLTAGHNHTCAIRRDGTNDAGAVNTGTIVCWGDNSLGQSTPPTLQVLFSLSYLSAGGDHTCVADVYNQVWCWGDHSGGQSTPPVGMFMSLAVGPGHACASRWTDNSIVCWGDDWGGATPVPPSGSYANLFADDYRTCGWENDGVKPVVCWGATYESEPWY